MRQPTAIPVARRPLRAPVSSTRDTVIDLACVALLPFVQMGLSYWVSVATLVALLVVVRGVRVINAGLQGELLWLAVVPLMFASLLLEGGVDFTQDLLRVAREAVCFVLMLALLKGSMRLPLWLNERLLMKALVIFTSIMLLYTAMEFVALKTGRYIGFPVDAYVQGQATIPGALALRYSHVRPAGSYSEPSYLGFVLLSVLMLALPTAGRRFGRPALIVMVILCGLLSQAASFILFAGLIGGLAAMQGRSAQVKTLLLPFAMVGLAALLAFGSDTGVLGRVFAGTSATGDLSVFVRIFGPAQALPSFIVQHPLGLPLSRLPEAMAPYALPLGVRPGEYLMNGFFNLFFEFGVFGLVLFIALISIRDGLLRTYLFSCMFFNGGFLTVDKVAVIGFTVIVYSAMRRDVGSGTLGQGAREPSRSAGPRAVAANPVQVRRA